MTRTTPLSSYPPFSLLSLLPRKNASAGFGTPLTGSSKIEASPLIDTSILLFLPLGVQRTFLHTHCYKRGVLRCLRGRHTRKKTTKRHHEGASLLGERCVPLELSIVIWDIIHRTSKYIVCGTLYLVHKAGWLAVCLALAYPSKLACLAATIMIGHGFPPCLTLHTLHDR